ncbi:hypothetical protein M885DRAFT_614508 [Pelagophyceae sp. CCMP2097]|nr:hypothetical protein M885DRAFT_614508 [Pelagophyceae sp. CCMP2097]|mmetsp:Transcript_15419/g.51977  ORF Transcript_15419/g.51977 Transcript_15419/m.51977 type:complete len:323 (+) Transcript_15419:89-1057(+)
MLRRNKNSADSLYDADEPSAFGESIEKSPMLRGALKVARCLVASTLLENSARVLFDVKRQASVLSGGSWAMWRLFAMLYIHFSWIAQLAGGVAVATGMNRPFMTGSALLYLASAMVVYGSLDARFHRKEPFGRFTYLCRTLSIGGGLLAAHLHAVVSHAREGLKHSIFADPTKAHAKTLQYGVLVARLLGAASALSHVARIATAKKRTWVSLIAVFLYSASAVGVAAGAASRVASCTLALMVLIQNLVSDAASSWVVLAFLKPLPPVAGRFAAGKLARRAMHLDGLRFYFFQDLAVFGALVLLALLGPGPASVDHHRRTRSD